MKLNKILDLPNTFIVNGTWQISGTHGPIQPFDVQKAMLNYHTQGFYIWDTADHYGPAEDFLGTHLENIENDLGIEERKKIKIFSKWVPTAKGARQIPDLDFTLSHVEKNIDRSLKRLRVDCLDLMQLHWWDYDNPNLYNVLEHLNTLKDKGKIKAIGLTNFDSKHLEKVLTDGFEIASNQVRYSLLDMRATHMQSVCKTFNVSLLAFGTLAGGYLDQKHFNTENPAQSIEFNKQNIYLKLINQFGGWKQFQKLLHCLNNIAEKHSCHLSSIASAFILSKEHVSAVIIGAHLGHSNHLHKTQEISDISLNDSDISNIEHILNQSRHLYDIMGPVASEYRGKAFLELDNL